MKQYYLEQIRRMNDNIEVNILLMVKKKFKDSEEIFTYVLGDSTGEIKVKTTSIKALNLNVGTVISVPINQAVTIDFDKLIIEEVYELNDFLPSVKRDIKNIMEELEALTAEEFNTVETQSLNDYFFKDEKFLNEFKIAIGGLNQHHNYIGGLAEHTLNVTYLAKVFAYRYDCRYKDIAILSAKLHDIGKVYEYSVDGPFSTSMVGEMEGHIVIGIRMIEEAFRKHPEIYSENFKNRIRGCIVQHHGRVEYGSPKPPNTEEAFIVHYADYVDATMNKISQIKDSTPKDTWSEYNKKIGARLLV